MALEDKDLEPILHALSSNPYITSLDVSYNEIGPDGAKALAENTTLTSLDVSDNQIGPDGAKALAQNTILTSLNLGGNQIGSDAAKALAENKTLTSLDVKSTQIGDAGANAFVQNKTLTSLNVSANEIGNDGAKALAQNTTLTSLDVSYNEIGPDGANAFVQNKTLTSLDVKSTQIGDAGANAFVQNKTLTSLDVSYNEIGPDGANAFVQNKTLTSLNVSANERVRNVHAIRIAMVKNRYNLEHICQEFMCAPKSADTESSKENVNYLLAKQYPGAVVSYMLDKAANDKVFAQGLMTKMGVNNLRALTREKLSERLNIDYLSTDGRLFQATGVSKNKLPIKGSDNTRTENRKKSSDITLTLPEEVQGVISQFLRYSADIKHPAPLPTKQKTSEEARGK